jgi:hypothetical protein
VYLSIAPAPTLRVIADRKTFLLDVIINPQPDPMVHQGGRRAVTGRTVLAWQNSRTR